MNALEVADPDPGPTRVIEVSDMSPHGEKRFPLFSEMCVRLSRPFGGPGLGDFRRADLGVDNGDAGGKALGVRDRRGRDGHLPQTRGDSFRWSQRPTRRIFYRRKSLDD